MLIFLIQIIFIYYYIIYVCIAIIGYRLLYVLDTMKLFIKCASSFQLKRFVSFRFSRYRFKILFDDEKINSKYNIRAQSEFHLVYCRRSLKHDIGGFNFADYQKFGNQIFKFFNLFRKIY